MKNKHQEELTTGLNNALAKSANPLKSPSKGNFSAKRVSNKKSMGRNSSRKSIGAESNSQLMLHQKINASSSSKMPD